jgi:5-methylcytosine-specific restriction protein B
MLGAADDVDHPYLLLLDEMNLAHVERYFADALSGMESGSEVLPNLVKGEDGVWREKADGPSRLMFPSNLLVVGTVNIDETTYMFSPKVLDRANTMEFRVGSEDLVASAEPIGVVESGSDELVEVFLEAATSVGGDWAGRDQMAAWLRELHELLAAEDREFGHRVFFEALRFGGLLAEAGESDPMVALDLQVMQKVLPRVHGSIRQVGSTLEQLGAWCFHGPGVPLPESFNPVEPPEGEPRLPVSFDKITRMTRRLRANHFVSYAE